MSDPQRLTDAQMQLLRCPVCLSELNGDSSESLLCADADCGRSYPIIDKIPVIIYEEKSIFSLSDFLSRNDTYFTTAKSDPIRRLIRRIVPKATSNVSAAKNYRELAQLLKSASDRPQVLVVGGSILGSGIESLISEEGIELIESDVAFGPRCKLICDAHNIPIASGSIDGIVVQAVLEHVLDPSQCVDEFYRILRPGGFVYAETPFMQQVHAGAYDFTRFTHLGHRRLFRMFEEIHSGVACGPGTALAWSYMYFLMSFSTSASTRKALELFARLTSFWLKYFDIPLSKKPGSLDAASAVYFLGRKVDEPISDRDILKSYRGLM